MGKAGKIAERAAELLERVFGLLDPNAVLIDLRFQDQRLAATGERESFRRGNTDFCRESFAASSDRENRRTNAAPTTGMEVARFTEVAISIRIHGDQFVGRGVQILEAQGYRGT